MTRESVRFFLTGWVIACNGLPYHFPRPKPSLRKRILESIKHYTSEIKWNYHDERDPYGELDIDIERAVDEYMSRAEGAATDL